MSRAPGSSPSPIRPSPTIASMNDRSTTPSSVTVVPAMSRQARGRRPPTLYPSHEGRVRLLPAALLALVVVAGCSDDDDEPRAASATTTTTPEAEECAAADPAPPTAADGTPAEI